MKQDMKKWVEELKNTKEKKGFLVLSLSCYSKNGNYSKGTGKFQ